jgi:hypothetical protein
MRTSGVSVPLFRLTTSESNSVAAQGGPESGARRASRTGLVAGG